jgi:hypothetical protein
MAFLQLDANNGAIATTGVHTKNIPFAGKTLFVSDSQTAFATSRQIMDGLRSRGQLDGCGVLGEGGERGTGVVGIAGGVYDVRFRPGGRQAGDQWHDLPVFDFPETRHTVGVFGTGGNNTGVLGVSNGTHGVVGVGRFYGRAGCAGFGVQGWGVLGQVTTPAGDEPDTDSIAIFGVAASKFEGGQIKYVGQAGVFAGKVSVDGDLTVFGDLVTSGAKSAAVRHRDGSHRLLYCVESPESWFEDFGEARLVKGRAQVKLEPNFASLVSKEKYHVFVSAYDDSNGLYVSRRSAAGFEVRELRGGRSSVRFSYRIVAKRKDVVGKRLAKVTLPTIPKPPKPPAEFVRAAQPKAKRRSTRRRR